MKRHLLFQAPVGAVFAIAIVPGKWGFVRFFRGLSMGILSIVRNSPEMPNIDWKNPPIGWVFFSFAPDSDTTKVVKLGTVPFDDEEAAWSPPCFYPPDELQACYKIHERGTIRKTTAANDVSGMAECRTLTPARLADFLRERLASGELKSV